MKIIYKTGDCLAGSEVYVAHGCNAQGVMGSGIAKQIKASFSFAYDDYKSAEKNFGLQLGKVIISYGMSKCIFNCITQDKYGKDGKQYVDYDAVRECVRHINRYFRKTLAIVEKEHNFADLLHVAMPMIGSGLGGGDWNIIEKIIEEESTHFTPVVYRFEKS